MMDNMLLVLLLPRLHCDTARKLIYARSMISAHLHWLERGQIELRRLAREADAAALAHEPRVHAVALAAGQRPQATCALLYRLLQTESPADMLTHHYGASGAKMIEGLGACRHWMAPTVTVGHG